MQQLFGCIFIDRYVTPAALSPGPETLRLRFLAQYLPTLVFFCCHYMIDWYVTCMILSFNTVYVYFHSLNLLRVYNLEPIWMLFRFLIFFFFGGGEWVWGGGVGGISVYFWDRICLLSNINPTWFFLIYILDIMKRHEINLCSLEK